MIDTRQSGTKLTTSALICISFVLALMLVSCTSDAQLIREANEAAASSNAPLKPTPTLTPTPTVHQSLQLQESERKSMFEVRDGDCLKMSMPEIGKAENTTIVDCNGSWDGRVINSFVIEANGIYPGNAFFEQQAIDKCDRHSSYLFMPTEESWSSKDRTVTCLQESYGLETTQLDKLDRMVDPSTLMEGECFNEVPISQGMMVELVNCLGNWDFRVVNTFKLADGPFPGGTYIDRQVDNRCQRETNYIFAPVVETWAVGDRIVTCIQER